MIKHIIRYLISIVILVMGFYMTIDSTEYGEFFFVSGLIGIYVSTLIKE